MINNRQSTTTIYYPRAFEQFHEFVQMTLVISNSLISINRLSRLTAYLEVKILSLPKHENLTSEKYCGKEEKLLLRSNFSSFPQYYRYISNFKSSITYIFVKCGCSNYFFLNSENLICRGTDISKCFRESLGFRHNESRLYYIQQIRYTYQPFLTHRFCFCITLIPVRSYSQYLQLLL